jgi:uncharacterized damage-inducible protein DinB
MSDFLTAVPVSPSGSMSKTSLAGERKRFLSLFDQLVEHTMSYVGRMHEEGYAVVPIDTPVMFLGTRVNKIAIGGLVRHLILAEAHWFERLPKATEGEVIPFPDNAAVLEGVPDGKALLDKYRETYAQARAHVAGLTDADLNKTISFANRSYTGLGFLWSILGHHGFHVGQIDILMRQQGIEPPEYMEWPKAEGVVG